MLFPSRAAGVRAYDRLTDAADRIEDQRRSSPKRIEENRRDADRHRQDRVDQSGRRYRDLGKREPALLGMLDKLDAPRRIVVVQVVFTKAPPG